MTAAVENILYLGRNIKLIDALLNTLTKAERQSCYHVCHVTCTNDVEAVLAEKNYSHFICELSVPQFLADKIAEDYPLLKTTYLAKFPTPETLQSTLAIEELLTDEVKVALDSIRIPIYYKNKQGIFLACNRYFAEAVGMTTEQIIGKTGRDILPDNLLPGLEEVDRKLFTDNKVHLYECEYTDANGIHREVVFRKEAIDNSDVQIGTILDMSEINATKRLLDKERMMLRVTADLSSDLIFFKDRQGYFLGCNKQFEQFVGWPEPEILEKRDDEIFALQQSLLCQEQDNELMENNKIYRAEEYRTHENGQRHFIDMKKVPMLDKNGKVQGLIGIGRDITARYLMQKRLKIADAVFENSKENILVTDQVGNIISANKACCSASGFSESELLQENISLFASNQRNNIESALRKNQSWEGEATYRLKNGDIHFAWLEVNVVEHSEEGITNRIYSFVDLNQSKIGEEKIQFLAKHDPLTGLFNRIALFSRLEDALARANYKETPMAVVLVEINGFKKINDQYGHNAGDKVLKEIALRLKNCVFAKDTVARFGDDEFVIVVDELANEQDAAVVAQKIATQFNEKIIIENIEAKLSATIGISVCPDDGIDGETLLANAGKAIQRGKKDKSAAYHFYTAALTRYSNQQLELEKELKNALALDQFELHYQPQFDLNKRQISAVESSLRWVHPEQGVLLPSSFLSLAEESGLVIPLGLKMLRKAALQAVLWEQSAINFGRISVHISPVQLSQISFIADLLTVLKETGCAAQWLEFEVNEADFRSEVTIIHDNLLNISKLGIALIIDEFGAELPMLYAIEHFRVEKIKISKHLLQAVPGSLVPGALAKGMQVLARELGIDVINEGSENEQQTAFSTSRSIESGRGYFQAKAMKASEATFYLRCNKRGY